MSGLEKKIAKYILANGLFYSMVKYKKDYQQLNVIFKRVYGVKYADYRQEHGLTNPPINLNWQAKAKMVCEAFDQEIISYTKENKTYHPLIMKCMSCNRIYETTWDTLYTGGVCSCRKSFQRKVVDVNYYVKHYLQNGWELLNPDEFRNSHSILKLRHKCGHTIERKGKQLRSCKGVCICTPRVRPQVNPRMNKSTDKTKIRGQFTSQVISQLRMREVNEHLINVLREKLKQIGGKAVGIEGDQLLVQTCQGDTRIDIFQQYEKTSTQKLFDYGLSKNQIKGIKANMRKQNTTLIDVVNGEMIEKLGCGCIRKRKIGERAPLKHLCESKASKQFFEDLKHYPLHDGFNERWSLVEYQGKTKPITIECKQCGYTKTLKGMYAFHGQQRCGCEDNISYGERMIFNLLNHNNVEFESQYTLDNKRFDFLIPNCNLLVEYDGVQHTIDTPWWGLTHKDQIRNDKLKDKIAAKYNYELVRFSHNCGVDDIIKGLRPYLEVKKKKNFDYNKPVILLPDEIIDDYLELTFTELIEKYKGQGYALNTSRLNREFNVKYGMTKLEYLGSKSLPDEVLEDFKTMNVHELREKYPELSNIITGRKLSDDFKKKFGVSKLQFRAQPLPDEVLQDYIYMPYNQLKQKYKNIEIPITQQKLMVEFKAKYGLSKPEYTKKIKIKLRRSNNY